MATFHDQERMQQEQMKAEVEVAESQGEVAAAQEQLGSTWGKDGKDSSSALKHASFRCWCYFLWRGWMVIWYDMS